MLEIKNLSQLKKAIKEGKQFIIRDHNKEEFIGQIRKPNVIQENGVYTIVPNEPENIVTQFNNGKGSWLSYGKASDWDFYKGRCFLYAGSHLPEKLILAIDFID